MTISTAPEGSAEVGNERQSEMQAGDALAEALTNLKVAQSRGKSDGDEEMSKTMESQEPDAENGADKAAQRSHDADVGSRIALVIDPVLVDAMRNARDKTFVLQQEKDMEAKIRDEAIMQWDVPLMNSYQKLLVHRIADHFHLGHSLDPITKQVTLSKQENTCLPSECLSTLASNERLSEPASLAFPPLLNSLSGQSTPSSAVATPGAPFGVRIMRRPGAGTSRSDSPRNGSATPDEAGGSGARKDRRNRTLEEREAEYKEARLRIFGEESAAVASSSAPTMTSSHDGVNSSFVSLPLNEAEPSTSNNPPPLSAEASQGTNESRTDLMSPRSNGDTPSESLRSIHRSDSSSASSQSDIQQASYGYYSASASGYDASNLNGRGSYGALAYGGHESMQQPTGPYFVPSAGQWSNAPMSFQPPLDAYGRPMVPGNWMYVGYPPYVAGNGAPMTGYSDHSQSPAASSRSTSISAGTEGGRDSRHSSISEQNIANAQQQQPYQHVFANSPATASFSAPQMTASRSQSVSPSAPFNARRTPPSSGNVTPNSAGLNGPGPAWMPYHYPASNPAYLGSEYANGLRSINGQGPSRLASGTPPSGAMQANTAYFHVGRPDETSSRISRSVGGPGSGAGRGRGRASLGSDRSLYDPNKPASAVGASSAAPSSSVVSSGTSTDSRPSDVQRAKRDNSLPSMPYFSRSASSGAESQATRSTSSASTSSRSVANGDYKIHSPISSSPSVTRQMHSLPPRPDWAVHAGRSSSSSGSSVSNNPACAKPSAIPSTTDTPKPVERRENSA